MVTQNDIWNLLEEVKDPEIPVISIVELGMVNDVAIKKNKIEVDITPTFIACPAIQYIQDNIISHIVDKTGKKTVVKVSLDPAWSSNRISKKGKQKLKKFGLTPPEKHEGNICIKLLQNVVCPHCNSKETLIRSNFGSTLCRSMHQCNNCNQSFEHFKPI